MTICIALSPGSPLRNRQGRDWLDLPSMIEKYGLCIEIGLMPSAYSRDHPLPV